ncbi:MAG: hypothetical protein R3B96_00235 [Pirellulaceae bacterium]
MRAQGKYQDALNLYADILAPNPGMVTVQVEAAMTYHLWGRATTSGLGSPPRCPVACLAQRADEPGRKRDLGLG